MALDFLIGFLNLIFQYVINAHLYLTKFLLTLNFSADFPITLVPVSKLHFYKPRTKPADFKVVYMYYIFSFREILWKA